MKKRMFSKFSNILHQAVEAVSEFDVQNRQKYRGAMTVTMSMAILSVQSSPVSVYVTL